MWQEKEMRKNKRVSKAPDLEAHRIPPECPYALEHLLDEDYLPETQKRICGLHPFFNKNGWVQQEIRWAPLSTAYAVAPCALTKSLAGRSAFT